MGGEEDRGDKLVIGTRGVEKGRKKRGTKRREGERVGWLDRRGRRKSKEEGEGGERDGMQRGAPLIPLLSLSLSLSVYLPIPLPNLPLVDAPKMQQQRWHGLHPWCG